MSVVAPETRELARRRGAGADGSGGGDSDDADRLTAEALLNCLLREVVGPDARLSPTGAHLVVTLARSGRLLRLGLRRPQVGTVPRLTGGVEEARGLGGWHPVGWRRLAESVAEELAAVTGRQNGEFLAQVAGSHAAVVEFSRDRAPLAASFAHLDSRLAGYLDSEQALVAGHRFHPAPKSRDRPLHEWRPYAPELGARFRLRFLGVREGSVAEAYASPGDAAAPVFDRLGPQPPNGYRLLPAHPWQLSIIGAAPWLRRAFDDGLLVDLGPGPRDVVPTSSMRTVYDPATDTFCKFSLNARLTNCVRTHAVCELAGSVALTRILGPVSARLADEFPGTVLLREPMYRTVVAPEREAAEELAVIVRDGVARHLAPGVTPLLAASLIEPASSHAPDRGLFAGRGTDWLLAWWETYVRRVALPVLHLYLAHGVVLEAHPQNVLVGVDGEGFPAQVFHRDLEGAKLLPDRFGRARAALPALTADSLTYDAERGWRRVMYCLVVNHLAQVAATIADHRPLIEADLWGCARRVLTDYAHGHGHPPRMRTLLDGPTLPAKANLRLRWDGGHDRDAQYVPVPNPLGLPSGGAVPAVAASSDVACQG